MSQDTCAGCHAPMFWALHERTKRRAPLVRPPEDVRPNITIFTKEDRTYYRIVKPGEGEFINHFGNCAKAASFRPKEKTNVT